jgi:hypothetical protein
MIDHFEKIGMFDAAVINQARLELAAFEQNPTIDWQTTCSTLFNCINTIVTDFANKLHKETPALFISTTDYAQFESRLTYEPGMATRLTIGAQLIRDLLLVDDEAKQHTFIWSLAHEMGRLADPGASTYASAEKFRRTYLGHIAPAACIAALLAIIAMFAAIHCGFINTFANIFQTLLTILTFFMTVFLLAGDSISLHLIRKREYMADCFALQLMPDFQVNDLSTYTDYTHNKVVAFIAKQIPTHQNNWFLQSMFKQVIRNLRLAKYTGLYPALKSRISRIEKFMRTNTNTQKVQS